MFFLYLLNKLRKSNKMLALSRILLFFCNEFNQFNNTMARVLDSIIFIT